MGGNGGNGASLGSSSADEKAGDFANGILAQSIGGGGGTNGSVMTYSFALTGGELSSTSLEGAKAGTGNGGQVSVENHGEIVTHGGFAHGILAQSIGGGFGGISGNGGIGNGNISVTLGGAVRGGSGAGVGVNLDGGVNNTLTNSGSISLLSGTAILASTGNDLIENYGTISGLLGDLSMSYTFSGCPAGYQYHVLEDGGALYLVATNTVPAPGALLLTSLGLLGWRRRGVSS